jgi:hypothetical protein
VCLPKGAFKSADIRARLGSEDDARSTKPELMAQLAAATDTGDLCAALWGLGARSRGDAAELAFLLDHPDAEVRDALAGALASYRGRAAVEMLHRLAGDADPEVSETARDGLFSRTGERL